MDDACILARLVEELAADPGVDSTRLYVDVYAGAIHATVRRGWVALAGLVGWDYQGA